MKTHTGLLGFILIPDRISCMTASGLAHMIQTKDGTSPLYRQETPYLSLYTPGGLKEVPEALVCRLLTGLKFLIGSEIRFKGLTISKEKHLLWEAEATPNLILAHHAAMRLAEYRSLNTPSTHAESTALFRPHLKLATSESGFKEMGSTHGLEKDPGKIQAIAFVQLKEDGAIQETLYT